MKKALKVIGLAMLSGLVLTACKKYDEGGTLRKAEKNLTNSWKIESYYLDGVDNTSNLLITNFSETFSDGGTYTRIFNDASGDAENQSGLWSLADDNTTYDISGTGSYELTSQTSTVSTSNYIILKLKKDELWYKFENGGNVHEFHMIPN